MNNKVIFFALNNQGKLMFYDIFSRTDIGISVMNMAAKRFKKKGYDVHAVKYYREFLEIMNRERIAA